MLLFTAVTENVFRASRRVNGKRVVSRLYRGRYFLGNGMPVLTVSLNTPDRRIAEKRLRDIIVEKQKELEGMTAPRSQREAQSLPLLSVLADYKADLVARDLAEGHVKETVARIQRTIEGANWRKLSDIRPESFIRFRASLRCSAKTKKEYQTSINAFLNWCVRTDRLATSPLEKIDRIDIRGKSSRPSRPYTVAELLRLFAITPHKVFYRTLLYTGQRVSEVAALVWSDLNLNADLPCALFREGTMKDKKKRAVPIYSHLASILRAHRPLNAQPNDLVFPDAPTYETLRVELKRASIDHKDALGRVVHLHAFRKTLGTIGSVAGMTQRSLQAIFGHSDPALTANIYTDAASLQLHDEIAKLPWIALPHETHKDAHKNVRAVVRSRKIEELVAELVTAVKSSAHSEDTNVESEIQLAARGGRHSELFGANQAVFRAISLGE